MKKIIIYITIFIVVALAVGVYVLNMVGNKLLDVAIESMTDIPELDLLDEAEIEDVLKETPEDDIEIEPTEEHVEIEEVEEQDKIDTPVAKESGTEENTVINNTDSGKPASEVVTALNDEEKGNAERNNGSNKLSNSSKTENVDNSRSEDIFVEEKHDNINQGQAKTDKGEDKENNVKLPAFTVDDIEAIKNRVTVEDRIKAALLVLRKLSPGDIALLKSMLKGGISVEEKEQAKQLVYSRFNDEEVQQIKEIYRKYIR